MEPAIIDDTKKGTTLADPDGPLIFVESLGCKVPTFVKDNTHLIADKRKGMKRLNYHVPYQMRMFFTPDQWPDEYRKSVEGLYHLTSKGFVQCTAMSNRVRRQDSGQFAPDGSVKIGQRGANVPCKNRAVNRTLFCQNHGGALNPGDRKISLKNSFENPQERVQNLSRAQKFMQGFISIEDLTDDEVSNGFIWSDVYVANDGFEHPSPGATKVLFRALDLKFEQLAAKELHRRLNDYLKSKAPRAMEVIFQMADSDLVEPADRFKASQWIAERVIGKTPDIVVSVDGGKDTKPYENILDNIQSGSREDYRKSVASTRGETKELSGPEGIVDVEVVGESEESLDQFEDEPVSDDPEIYLDDQDEETEEVASSEVLPGVHSVQGTVDERLLDDDLARDNFTSDDSDNYSVGDNPEPDAKSELERKADLLINNRTAATLQRERIQKAKRRRYAARAVGVQIANDFPLVVQWRVILDVNSEHFGCFKMKLWGPDSLTEKRLEDIAKSNDETRQHVLLQRAAAAAGVVLETTPEVSGPA